MKIVADTLAVGRPNLSERVTRPDKPRGRYRRAEDESLLPLISQARYEDYNEFTRTRA
jgi:hypothetical protein